MDNNGRWDDEESSRRAQDSFAAEGSARLQWLTTEVAEIKVVQQNLFNLQVAHTVRSTHAAQFFPLCVVAGGANIILATYLFKRHIWTAMQAIGDARVSPFMWLIVALLMLTSIWCVFVGFKRPPCTIDGVKRFGRFRCWGLLSLIALDGFAAWWF